MMLVVVLVVMLILVSSLLLLLTRIFNVNLIIRLERWTLAASSNSRSTGLVLSELFLPTPPQALQNCFLTGEH